MYLLEKFHLVQFYLFSKETLHFGRSSAIVAPNGSGKSAVLDAMQIVLHGGDQNAIDLNAQSGGQKGGRSIREYLLGFYRDAENVRDNSTCYLTMVFRDSSGKHPVVSAGISMGASINEPKHRIYGMYILPGVDLQIEEHFEDAAEDSAPVQWGRFKAAMRDLSRDGADKPQFFDKGASEFVQALLFQLRSERSRSTDHVAFSKALKNALNLKDVHDASAFVRERIVEARPISVSDFRHQLESFRSLRAKIEIVKERIEESGVVLEQAIKVITTRMRKASYKALLAELARDQIMDELDSAQENMLVTGDALERATKLVELTEAESKAAARRYEALRDQARQDPSLQKGRDLAADRERALMPLKKNIATELQRVTTAFRSVAEYDSEAVAWGFLGKPWDGLLTRIRGTSQQDSLGLDPKVEAARLVDSIAGTQPVLAKLKQKEGVDQARAKEARSAFDTAVQQLNRAKEGKSSIPDEVVNVQNKLADEGIRSTPLSDLVQVSDMTWAPAIEAYLRGNAYALLVEPGREDEALRTYEAIPDGYNPFGVKILQPKHYPSNTDNLPARSVARLLQGENEQAVGFLRSKLGKLVQLEKAHSRSEEGLTRNGVLVKGGTIERLRLPLANKVALGKKDTRAQIDFLSRERLRCSNDLEEVERTHRRTAKVAEVSTPLLGLKDVVENIERWLVEHAALEREFEDREIQAQAELNPDLVEQHRLFDQALDEQRRTGQLHLQAVGDLGSAQTRAESAATGYAQIQARSNELAADAVVAMQAPYVDAGWIDERRNEWEKQGKNLAEMVATCSSGAESDARRHGEQESTMRTSVQQYAHRHPFELAFDPSNPDLVRQHMEAEIKRLTESELVNYQRDADEAYSVAVRTFRSRIAASLHSSFSDMDRQLRDLNSLMSRLPAFTNDERYKFRWGVLPDHKSLHKFIGDVAVRGADDDLFNDPVNTPEEFRSLLEDVDGPYQDLLRDYRRFYWFDVDVTSQGESISTLKSRMEKGSGGEHRAPLFVVAGAALAAAYGKLQGDSSGMSLILFDELGDKIDGNNTKAVFEYLRELGLQPIVAAPDDALGKINESVEGYVELYRDGSYLSVNHVGIGPAADDLLNSDNWVRHPELLEQEAARIEVARKAAEDRKSK